MSRVGKLPISLPSGVTAKVESTGATSQKIVISGPKGSLNYATGTGVNVVLEGNNKIVVSVNDDTKQSRANFGTTRANLNNMVKGVVEGWKRSLEMSGVGFNAKVTGPNLVLSVGFSHDVLLPIPAGTKCVVNKNTIEVEGADKIVVGAFASKIRMTKKPEPYLGKGIKYTEEVIRRKAGKTGKK